MKLCWLKRTISGLLSAFLIASAIPASAQSVEETGDNPIRISPLAGEVSPEQVNPDYLEWVKNGKEGTAPAMLDLSYLAESYARVGTAQNAALLPEEYDLRDYGQVTPVINQGILNLCWAVSASDAAAGPLLDQFPQTAISGTHTAWFSKLGAEEHEYFGQDIPYDYGGTDGIVVGTWAAWKGPVTIDLAPNQTLSYSETFEESDRLLADYHLQDAYYMIFGVNYNNYLLQISRDLTKQFLMQNGTMTISYYASDNNAYRQDTCAWYNDQYHYADHTVVLVGWDDNYPKENFAQDNQPEHDGAWLVKNSWGNQWGDDGYFWLSYEDASIESGPAFLLEEADNYATNYQYDTIGWCASYNTLPDGVVDPEQARNATAANIFTAQGAEQLEAVSFYTTDVNVDYTISIYTGVEEGQPQSGTLQLEQSGMELYAGYHTIELEQPVKLNPGERFSIVLTLKNPTFEYPLALEMYYSSIPNQAPTYMGNGGESYVLMPEGWEDIAGSMGEYMYCTNVCIKGFTNPLPQSGEAVSTVRFSEMEGPLADGTELTLSAEGTEEIYYSVNGGEYQLYTQPIPLDLEQEGASQTISAYGVSNGKQGNVVEKTYTKAAAQLTDLAIQAGGTIQHYETSDFTTRKVPLPNRAESVRIMAQSCDTIYVDGVKLNSSDWSGEIALTPGETTTVTVSVTGEGKTTTNYTFQLYRSVLNFDYHQETILFDPAQYQVTDTAGNPLHPGDSITSLIGTELETPLLVTAADGTEFQDFVPSREALALNGANYFYETTMEAFSDNYWYSLSPDMSDAVICQYDYIPLTPGVDVYIQKRATDAKFASTVYHLEVPDRPAAPEVEVTETTETSITLASAPGAIYTMDGGQNWQESPVFTQLTPGETYHIEVCLPSTSSAFASEITQLTVQTLSSEAPPVSPDEPEQKPETDPEQPSSDSSQAGNTQTEPTGEAQPSPTTYDTANLPVWTAVLLLSGGGLIFLLSRRKKQR